jgi:hypothetical protein
VIVFTVELGKFFLQVSVIYGVEIRPVEKVFI